MSPEIPSTRAHSSASGLFAHFNDRVRAGESVTLDALCAEHPAHADELRELHALHAGLARLLETEGLSSRDAADPAAEALLASYQGRKGLFASRYRVDGRIDAGGMGVILKAFDTDVGREVALKIIRDQDALLAGGRRANVSRSILARFLNEARITGQLEHPAIVPVHEIGVDGEGRPFFAMKLIQGRSLGAVLKEAGQPSSEWTRERVLDVLLRVCDALAYAHDKDVIHRDLKPSNIMVGDFGEVYVMDWGLAKRVGEAEPASEELLDAATDAQLRDAAQTDPGAVVGTAYYMSPEQATGDRAQLGVQSDVYAIGAMLYEVLAGRPPFHRDGESSTPTTIRERQARWELAPLPTAGVPAELESICKRAMARESIARYRDMRELARDLRAFLDGKVVAAYQTGAWAETKKWVERNRPLAAALVGAVVLLIAGMTASLVFKTRADARAADLLAANTTIEARNVALDSATQTARANEAEARRQEELAKQQEAQARAEKANVLKLSAFQTLDDLTNEAEALWPADPGLVPAYLAWMKRAEELVAKLPDFRASLAEIERRAVPQSAEERAQERASHPRAQELEEQAARLTWLKRMLGEEPWPSESDVEAELAQGLPASTGGAGRTPLPTDAIGLNALAWPFVDPDKPVYGSEVRGLVLARRAVAAGAEKDRYQYRDTLAWAYFKLGRFDEALADEQRALAEAEDGKKPEYAGYVAKLERAVRSWRDPEGHARETRVKEREVLAQAVAALETEVTRRREWQFAEEAAGGESGDRWWHAQLLKLVASLESFEDAQTGLMRGVSEAHGWGVARRLEFAASIEEQTLNGADAKRRWDEAIAAIVASPKYGRLVMTPQLGLLPIGTDPASGLWEFWHVQSGEEPQRGADGKLVLSEKMGIVLVLIPGGTFTLGAQAHDPTGPNYDREAQANETPYAVPLDAYFLSKYEMTQAQGERFLGRNPSYFGPRNYSASWNRKGDAWNGLHPVEQVSWNDCARVLKRLGLDLPTEAQWEHGCRGSKSSVYWGGDDPATLVDAGNVADQFAKANGGGAWTYHESWDDGQLAPAEVGSYRANDLGLHDTHGNVFEWCRDGYGTTTKWLARSGERDVSGASARVFRGGSFSLAASYARSAARSLDAPEFQRAELGLRPARASRLSASPLHAPGK